MRKTVIFPGDRFGRLTVVGRGPNAGNRARWHCRCDCGNETITWTTALRSGHSQSCGCLHKEITRMPKSHGLCTGGISPEMKSFQAAVARCNRPSHRAFHLYGGRGITVSPEWIEDPRKFVEEIGLKPSKLHSIERIDVNKNYEPGNVRWATRAEQSRNTRRNVRVCYQNQEMVLTDFCRLTGRSFSKMRRYIVDQNRTLEDACQIHDS